jgi:O-antigen ligase
VPVIARLGVFVLLAFLALLPFGRAAELALLTGTVLGLIALLCERQRLLADPRLPLLLVLFLGYWLPELLSAGDAIAPRKAWGEVLADLRLLPFSLFALVALPDAHALRRLLAGAALILALWIADALLAALLGRGLGGPEAADRLSGIFGADNLKLGPTLAALSPLLLWPVSRRLGAWAGAALLFVLGLVVLLAGARAGWLMLALAALAWLYEFLPRGRRLPALAAVAAVGLGLVALTAWQSERFAARLERTALLFQGDTAAIDEALAGRLPIWRAALSMYASHPVNGVGVRGFRHAYLAHAQDGDPWVGFAGDPHTGAFHAHQLVLEIASETGTLGLACWLLAGLAAFRAWRRTHFAVRADAWPVALALLLMLFPLNTHFAFYSSFWGTLFWWLIALYAAALRR